MNPIVDRNYVNIVKHRRVEAEHGRRPIMSLESVETNKGRLNQMSGGWANVISKMGKGLVVSRVLYRYQVGTRYERGEV